MREIKFRAWSDDVKKEMFYGNEVAIALDGSLHLSSCDWYHTFNDNKGETINWIEIMQYTGLKDKNNREIYEGDILQYENKIVRVGFNNEIGAFVMKGLETWDCMFPRDEFKPSTFEIIGNIRENPELLEVK